jgi:hypothetical protein
MEVTDIFPRASPLNLRLLDRTVEGIGGNVVGGMD